MTGRFDAIEKAKSDSKDSKELIGKSGPADFDNRANCELRFLGELREMPASVSDMTSKLFESSDSCDRGGLVLELTSETDCGFHPHAVSLPNGFELHLCGDEEAEAAVKLIVRTLLRSKYRNAALREAASAVAGLFLPLVMEDSRRG